MGCGWIEGAISWHRFEDRYGIKVADQKDKSKGVCVSLRGWLVAASLVQDGLRQGNAEQRVAAGLSPVPEA